MTQSKKEKYAEMKNIYQQNDKFSLNPLIILRNCVILDMLHYIYYNGSVYFVATITKCTLAKAYALTNQLCDSVTSDRYGVATFSQGCMFFGA